MRRPSVGLLLGLGLAGAMGLLLGGRRAGLALVTELIRLEQPEVRWITGEELAHATQPLVLLDVRRQDEFAVSHLAGARRLEPGTSIPPDVLLLARGTPIVAYCAVGRRSAALALALQAAGFTDVRNLEGSLFRWANEGRPMVNQGGATTKVHPYNVLWGLLLRPEHRGP